jgi:M6 family metalloprotease-like protein
MKDKIKKYDFNKMLVLISILFITIQLQAVPAYRGSVLFKQPDGSTITIKLHGDEFYNYRTTTDGYLVDEDAEGYMAYAKVDEKGVLSSLNIRANEASKRTAKELQLLSTIQPVGDLSSISQIAKQQKVASAGKTVIQKFPLSGSPKSLVILVNFSDKNFVTTDPKAAFTNLLNEEGYSTNGGTGSAKDYFRDNSGGKFNPEFNVVGPYTLPGTMATYGANSGSSDKNARQMVIDACTLAAADGLDFSQYDTDNDGFVDNVFIYYAGYNEAEGGPANTIWPHRWVLASYSTKFNGKIVYDYACTSELKGTSGSNMCGIGTFVHEFGHVLGLPDFYATNSASHHTLYSWDVMDYGPYNNSGRTPPNYSSYERFFTGWLTPSEISSSDNLTLNPLPSSNNAYLISQTGGHNLDPENPSPTEFFLLENRQKSGWDTYLPGHGLLVTRVYYDPSTWYNNTVNNISTAMGVDIIEADGVATDGSCSGDAFPGTSKVTSYNPTSRAGSSLSKPLTDITEANGIISFKFMGGKFVGDVAPVASEASNITQTSFTASWSQVESATAYLLDVFTIEGQDTIYVDGFKSKNVGNVASYEVSGLAPATTHYYSVKATNGKLSSLASNVVTIQTKAYTFDTFKPKSLPASDITDHSFVANWEQLDEATGFGIDVYTKEFGTEITDSIYGFTTFPTGWSKNFDLYYTTSGMYGQESPSLRLSYNNNYLQTPLFDLPFVNFQFWYRGSGVASSNSLAINGSKDGQEWTLIKQIQPIENAAQTVTLSSEEVSPFNAIKIVYNKVGAGSIAIDDARIKLQSIIKKPVSPYLTYPVGNILSYKVEELLPNKEYYYKITALNADLKSLQSEEVKVTTNPSDPSTGISFDTSNAKVLNLPESIIVSVTDGGTAKVKLLNISGQVVYTNSIESSLTIQKNTLHKGAYLLIVNNVVYKINY